MVLDIPVQPIIELIQQHGVLAVMVGMVVEEVFVPIPSPVIPMAAGAILIETTSLIEALIQILFVIAIPASLASVVSSYFVFSISYFGGKPVIEKYGAWIDVSWEEVQSLEKHFDSGKEKYYVALFRAIPVVPLSLVSGSAGLFRMDWKEYGVWSFIGMMPRNFILAFVGWYAKDGVLKLASRIDTVSTAVAVLIALSVFAVILYQNLKDFYRWIIRETG